MGAGAGGAATAGVGLGGSGRVRETVFSLAGLRAAVSLGFRRTDVTPEVAGLIFPLTAGGGGLLGLPLLLLSRLVCEVEADEIWRWGNSLRRLLGSELVGVRVTFM